jgi:phage protein D
MNYDIMIGKYTLGMLDSVEVHRSVELLADTAKIVLPCAEYGAAIKAEEKLKRGDNVIIALGYKETGLKTEFTGYLQEISTDGGKITLTCEDGLFLFRKDVPDRVMKKVALSELLAYIVKATGKEYTVDCSYTWAYSRFVIHSATGFDVLKKVQEDSGADIYLKDGVLHVHAPGEKVGTERVYDFSKNIETSDLTYRKAEDKKVQVVVKARSADGKVVEKEYGTTGGDKIEIKCSTSDEASMKARGELEVMRHSFTGYDGSITTWLIPQCNPGDSARLHDKDYSEKDGVYFVRSVTTDFSSAGGKRKIELGFKLS